MSSVLFSVPILILLSYAAWTDLKRREIDNWVSITLLLYSIAVKLLFSRSGLLESIVYTVLVFAFLFVAYSIHACGAEGIIGGGDVKLLTSLAFFYGKDIIVVIFFACAVGTVYGLIVGIKNRTYLKTSTAFAPAILVGTLLVQLLEVWRISLF